MLILAFEVNREIPRPILFLAQFFLRVGVKGNIVDQVISDHNASAADTSKFLMAIDGKQEGVDDAANGDYQAFSNQAGIFLFLQHFQRARNCRFSRRKKLYIHTQLLPPYD